MPSPRYWREIPTRYRLEGCRCQGCEKVIYPKRRVCPSCRGEQMEPIHLSKRGTIVTSTVIEVAPTNFRMEAPYGIAVVETPEHARLMVQVVDADLSTIGPGTEVELEFRRIQKEGHGGILCYGYKAVPATG